MRFRWPSLPKLSMGYRFDRDREVVALIYLNYALVILFSIIVILIHLDGEENLLITYRYHAFLLLGVLNLWLIRAGYITLVRVLILFLTPFLILILPLLTRFFDDEFYFWFPYIPIALSIVPHFILHTYRHRTALIVTLVLYLLLALFIDDYMILMSDNKEGILTYVIKHRFYYGLIPVIIFIFVNLAIGLVFAKNYEYEQIVHRQQDELIQSEKMASLGTLTAGIAHEINNPLNFISGSMEALYTIRKQYEDLEGNISAEQKALAEQGAKIMESAFEGVKRISDIISSLQFFANPGKAEIRTLDLNQLIHEVLLRAEKKIPYNVSLTRHIPSGMTVHCFEDQLRQALLNIIENALEAVAEKSSPDQKRIEISASESKRNKIQVTQISIGNNGPAIPEKELKNIFDPFFTLKSEGKGLGMTMCYMIIKEHKGWIEVKNKGDGVVFDVYLPKI